MEKKTNKNKNDSIALQAEIVLIKKKTPPPFNISIIYILRNPLGLLLDSVELSFLLNKKSFFYCYKTRLIQKEYDVVVGLQKFYFLSTHNNIYLVERTIIKHRIITSSSIK